MEHVNNNYLKSSIIRFNSKYKINTVSGCWEWQHGIRGSLGYGAFWFNGKQHNAHRFSYEIFKGKIPENLVIDHLCKNPKCVNPNHLEVVTTKENLLRGNTFQAKNAKKTHCPRGHEYNKENTYISKRGYRQCKKCNALKSLKFYYKNKGE